MTTNVTTIFDAVREINSKHPDTVYYTWLGEIVSGKEIDVYHLDEDSAYRNGSRQVVLLEDGSLQDTLFNQKLSKRVDVTATDDELNAFYAKVYEWFKKENVSFLEASPRYFIDGNQIYLAVQDPDAEFDEQQFIFKLPYGQIDDRR